MNAPHLTALGIERNGRRIATVGGHREGVSLRLASDFGNVICTLSPDEADHLSRLLAEQAANARLAARAIEEVA
ncbi:hypothetical protein [Methylobacterium segetis]|uniref:hypothetical protein n=1 Tax=Methylobacterium segetis TaxID=2488750 RepID=UPI00104F2596|nr:hypothetical protein [Methylobacterium segetis]